MKNGCVSFVVGLDYIHLRPLSTDNCTEKYLENTQPQKRHSLFKKIPANI